MRYFTIVTIINARYLGGSRVLQIGPIPLDQFRFESLREAHTAQSRSVSVLDTSLPIVHLGSSIHSSHCRLLLIPTIVFQFISQATADRKHDSYINPHLTI